MQVVIFVPRMEKAPEYIQEVAEKLKFFGPYKIANHGSRITLQNEGIYLDVRLADPVACGGLYPKYWFADPGCSYDFCEYAAAYFRRSGKEQMVSLRHLVMTIIETILYEFA